MYTNHLSLWIYAGTRRLTRQIAAWRGTYGEERHWSVVDRRVLHPGTPHPLPKTCAFCWMHWLRVFRRGVCLNRRDTQLIQHFLKHFWTHPISVHQRLHLLRIWSSIKEKLNAFEQTVIVLAVLRWNIVYDRWGLPVNCTSVVVHIKFFRLLVLCCI